MEVAVKRRIVRPNKRSYTGRHVSHNAKEVRYESGLERDFLTLIRFRTDVLTVVEQPETFRFIDSAGRERRYTPDFKVTFTGKTVFYEVKYRAELRKNWNKYRDAVAFMRRHCPQIGAAFRIVTDLIIRTPRCENIRLISSHQRRQPDPAVKSAIKAALATGPLAIVDLCRLLCPTLDDRAGFYATLWSLIARLEIKINFNQPISMESQVWL